MSTRQYIGARYVPKFFEGAGGSTEWVSGVAYEALTMVTHLGNTLTSKKPVPVGIDITNTEYWVVTGNYNAQVEQYRQEVTALSSTLDEEIDTRSGEIEQVRSDISVIETTQDNQTVAINKLNTFANSVDVHNTISTGSTSVAPNVPTSVGTITVPPHSSKFIYVEAEFSANVESQEWVTLKLSVSSDPSSHAGPRTRAISDCVKRLYSSSGTGVFLNKCVVLYNTSDNAETYHLIASHTHTGNVAVYPFACDLSFLAGIEIPVLPSIPDFYREYITNRLETINQKDNMIGNTGTSFIFITDLHNNNRHYSTALAKHIRTNSLVKKLVYGGDYINVPSTSNEAISLLSYRTNLYRLSNDTIFIRGNHETNPYAPVSARLTDEQVYNILCSQYPSTIVTNGKMYYYTDEQNKKIRTIYLDTGVHGSIAQEQLSWFTNVINELDSTWTVILISHMLVENSVYNDRSFTPKLPVINQITNVLRSATCHVACWVGGHSHIDMSEYNELGFPMILTTCDVHGPQVSEISSDNREEGTINEQAFDVYHIDTLHKKVYVTRIGGGRYNAITSGNLAINDREYNYN